MNNKRQFQSLAEFILYQMKIRDIGVREFAKLIGVRHGTISKHISKTGPHPKPTVDFLVKLSQQTGTPIETLIGLVSPNYLQPAQIDTKAESLARFIMQLPESTTDTLFAIARSMQAKSNKSKTS